MEWALLMLLPLLFAQDEQRMIVPAYEIRIATHAHGKGVFLKQAVKKGQVLLAPDAINKLYNDAERAALIPGSPEDDACVRWFETFHTVSTDWPDDCYVNHSFKPSGLWHLGFIFAMHDLKPEDEITVDYRFVVNDNEKLPFLDSETGAEIIGYTWEENLKRSTEQLLAIL